MTMTVETSLRDFNFWGGAAEFVEKLTLSELDTLESILSGYFAEAGDYPSETEINDMFWFESETLAEWLDTTEDEIMSREGD